LLRCLIQPKQMYKFFVAMAPPIVLSVSADDVDNWMHQASHGYIHFASTILPVESVRFLASAFAKTNPLTTVHEAAAVFDLQPSVRVRMMLWLRDMMLDVNAAHLAAQYAVAFWAAQNGAGPTEVSSVAVATLTPEAARELTHEDLTAAATLCVMGKG